MEIVKKTDKYVILKKRSGRFGVRSMNRSWINGPEKEKILAEAGLQSITKTKKESGEDEKAKPAADEEDTQSFASV
ncbi:MAG: hypothetical protein A2381_08085 [Bdellovibrionales bacterium RIFOXYB1_FULL_37_110]|nr:MAG: hypothetical protein A2181_04850 [Bdellovibrionales bacterium RIFOXYA1_FULL_38_20]OFZ52563.1 MAG: hypothetical protein A2417_00805 [Bdellovibrionales bacterium RIFOXYC1_FULL_37_79]OFZ59765.1 MAG: hypothetical protein A2381_08085 [Bdellovibrionales bacterium RIFOXYB1_FULL_37_110]OFZ65328.1 MAG: hypothetical protein A2577_04245 [Bdellovibrionales bacterium RIFOXYD1_FULL_36_51]